MREIKFRGKQVDNGERVEGSLLITELVGDLEPAHYFICPIKKDGMHRVDPATVGQYTGLKDKNETEIYEGDILKCVDLNGDEYTTAVSFDGGAFAVDSTGCDYDYTAIGWAMEFDIDECWVIGNIHDNPERLGGAE